MLAVKRKMHLVGPEQCLCNGGKGDATAAIRSEKRKPPNGAPLDEESLATAYEHSTRHITVAKLGLTANDDTGIGLGNGCYRSSAQYPEVR